MKLLIASFCVLACCLGGPMDAPGSTYGQRTDNAPGELPAASFGNSRSLRMAVWSY